MKKIFIGTLSFILAGCVTTMNVTMMPRNSGTSYNGELQGNGSGSGTMSVDLGEIKCTGPAARVASNQSFGLVNTFGYNNRGTVSNTVSTVANTGDSAVKAILSCSDGKGLRCDLTGRDGVGGGVCADDTGRVFDVIISRK